MGRQRQETWQFMSEGSISIFYVFIDDKDVAKISSTMLHELLEIAGARQVTGAIKL